MISQPREGLIVDKSDPNEIPAGYSSGLRAFRTTAQERHAQLLLDQQLWCFGRDVKSNNGDILIGIGMWKAGKPGHMMQGCSSYSIALDQETTLTVWGFGFAISKTAFGSIFVSRHHFFPLFTQEDSLTQYFAVQQFAHLHSPKTNEQWKLVRQLLPRAALWFSRYEHTVAELYGRAYRQATLDIRDRPPHFDANKMAEAWDQMGKRLKHAEHVTSGSGIISRLSDQLRARYKLQQTSLRAQAQRFPVSSPRASWIKSLRLGQA